MQKSKYDPIFPWRLAGVLLISSALASCVPSKGSGGRKSNSQKIVSTATPTPTASSGSSSNTTFLQNGGVQTTTTLGLASSFADSIYMRGKDVHEYQKKGGNTTAAQCALLHFPASLDKKVLVMAARPNSFQNFSTGQLERYYLLSPADKAVNQANCQTPGVLSKVASLFGTSSVSFALAEVCPSCLNVSVASQGMRAVDAGGLELVSVGVSHLSLQILSPSGGSSPVGTSCTTSVECQSKGMDCCSGNVCVNDGQIKNGVNQSLPDFIQAQQDILANAANIINYPEFYHLCGSVVHATPVPTPGAGAGVEAAERLQRMTELYECSSLQQGEMSICTKTYKDVHTNPVDFTTGADDRNFQTNYTGVGIMPAHSIVSIRHADVTLFTEGGAANAATYRINGVNPGAPFIPSAASVPGTGSFGVGNDSLTDPVRIYLNHPRPTTAPNDTLKIRYKIDGSCEPVNAQLARCKKHYIQGGGSVVGAPGKVTDHSPASNTFCLPAYADTSRTIKLEVDDANIAQGGVEMDWNVISTPCKGIRFVKPALQVQDTQKVVLTYYVELGSYNVLQSKLDALNQIDQMCNCGGPYCTLRPVTVKNSNNVDVVTDYACVYPVPVTNVPLQQDVFLSAKTVPLRYFDKQGVFQNEPTLETRQESWGPVGQENFKYANGDLLKPNNVSGSAAVYMGFNEIYGSLDVANGNPKPAKQVLLTAGKTYDIFVDTGNFSQCTSCGTDYYSLLAKLFPLNFLHKGGGYQPDGTTTNPFKAATYRAHDLSYGRACFVPASMIPWSHRPQSDRAAQRKGRLMAQHFYFANGYNRDWYGFDYASVIGSFDGVRWFAIGNQRRIKATSGRLFLAINAYFGDLTIDANYKVVVSDASTAIGSGPTVSSDFGSDGAQCQKYHQCNTDTDCVTQLGWEYMCAPVSSIESKWPTFDANGTEIVMGESTVTLTGLTGASLGSSNRCVYRGKGAPCVTDMVSTSASFNGSINVSGGTTNSDALALNSCAPNYYCQAVTPGAAKFNIAIARFGKTPTAQNAAQVLGLDEEDTVGLGARLIGRPLFYKGDQEVTLPQLSGIMAQFSNNAVSGICLPGRNPGSSDAGSVKDLHATAPGAKQHGDQANGIGVAGDADVADWMLSSCPVIDPHTKNYYFRSPATALGSLTLGNDTLLRRYSATQNLSTRALLRLQAPLDIEGLLDDYESPTSVTAPALQADSCLRAPGAACHSDLDCAPSKFIADKLVNVDSDDTSLWGILNKYEIQFWQQGLVCHQAREKTDPAYALRDNRCCRENGKVLTIGTRLQDPDGTPQGASGSELPDIRTNSAPGQDNISINGSGAQARYSRMSSVHTDIRGSKTLPSDSRGYSKLVVAAADHCTNAAASSGTGCMACTGSTCNTGGGNPYSSLSAFLGAQVNTFAAIAERTCCTSHWVRHFHEDNGGGHVWDSDKLQKIKKAGFRCLNWNKCTDSSNDLLDSCFESSTAGPSSAFGFTCEKEGGIPSDSTCMVRSIPLAEGKKTMDYLRKFDLLGIPQVTMARQPAEVRCLVNPDDQSDDAIVATDAKFYLDGVLFDQEATKRGEFFDSTAGVQHYTAADMSNFNESEMKPIFSADSISCCKPVGTLMQDGEAASNCCTGYADATNRCVLRANYTNVSVHFNKLVSSAARDLDPSFFNPTTGAIDDPNIVAQLACALNACESRVMARGVGLSNIKVPGHESSAESFRTRRFVDGVNSANSNGGLGNLYDAGMKWNDDLYCVPAALEGAIPESEKSNVIIIKC